MKIALVQTNPIIGDFSYNCQQIHDAACQAHAAGCRLAIFPEMAITGYPPQDLLERRSFIENQQGAVASLIKALPSMDVMFGCFEKRDAGHGKGLFNSAVVARDGKIIYRARKQLLPSYDVFDERRYFEPGESPELYRLDGLTFAVTVCEDLWDQEVLEYSKEPVNQLFERARAENAAIDAIINISASPFQRRKEKQKMQMFSRICTAHQVPLLYVNQVGGQDSLLFDGRSVLVTADGVLRAKGKGFATDSVFIESDTWQACSSSAVTVCDDEIASIYQGLVMGVRDYVQKCGFSKVVLGLSGGIDSALTAALAVDALGADQVLGVALPSPYSSQDSMEDAQALAENLGCRFEVLPIGDLFAEFSKSLQPLFHGLAEDLTEQNLQARIRGNLLMALSNKFGSLLLTTGNKSEMAVGYCTLYGDMSGGLAVISDVPKTVVYELANYINRDGERIPQRTITKPPSAELKPDQCDQDDLPPYDLLDAILELHLEYGEGVRSIVERGYDSDLVRDVVRRIRLNEYKRKQAPMGLKVTSKAFGYGRRYPNVQNFRD